MTVQKINLEKELYLKNKQLYKLHKKSQELLYNVSESVIVCDEKFRITLANKKSEILFGKNKPLIGKKLETVLHLIDKKNKIIPIKEFLSISSVSLNSLKQVIDGKDFYFNLRSTIINDEDEPEYIITLADITQERVSEISKDDFITVTSHELRTPMTLIQSYLFMLNEENKGPLNKTQKDYVTKALNSTHRMINLINDMLSVSRIEQGKINYKFEIFNIDDFVQECLLQFELKAKETGNKIQFEHSKDKKLVLADKEILKKIFYNLVGNSLKFTTNGVIKVSTVDNDRFVKIAVSDTGKGISKENMDKLFKKFGKLENSYETIAESGGTGLGLYITRQYVEGMGGKITAKSAGENKGAEFTFFIHKK